MVELDSLNKLFSNVPATDRNVLATTHLNRNYEKYLDNKEKAERIRASGCENGQEEVFCCPFFLGSEFTVPSSLFPVPL